MMATAVRFYIAWLSPLLLTCLLVLCDSSARDGAFSNSQLHGRSKRSSSQFDQSALKDPGVIVGIIVGVAGVLVVTGVIILLCYLYCCKEATCPCCPCCKEKETYLEAGTVPIKIPTQDGTPDNNSPISTILQNRPVHAKRSQGAGEAADTTLDLPRYDDVPEVDWKLKDLMEKRTCESGRERQSPDSVRRSEENSLGLSAGDRENSKGPPASGAKRREKTPTRRKLTYGADDPDASQSNGDFTPLEHEPKKRNPDVVRHGREFPATSQKHRRRYFQSTQEDDTASATERNPDEVTDEREFPLLEFEPRKRRLNPSPDTAPRPWEETRGDDRQFRLAGHVDQPQPQLSYANHRSRPEYVHQPQVLQPPYPDHRSPMWREDRRPGWDDREAFNASGPISLHNNADSTSVHSSQGRDNLAFNQDSTETTV